jgi:hypothetical protein
MLHGILHGIARKSSKTGNPCNLCTRCKLITSKNLQNTRLSFSLHQRKALMAEQHASAAGRLVPGLLLHFPCFLKGCTRIEQEDADAAKRGNGHFCKGGAEEFRPVCKKLGKNAAGAQRRVALRQ